MQWVKRGADMPPGDIATRRGKRTLALVCGAGQLGNQLFQAAFAERLLQPGDRVFTTGMGELLDGFDWSMRPVANLGHARRKRGRQLWIKRCAKLAVQLRLIDGIRQLPEVFMVDGVAHSWPGDTLQYSRGLISQVLFIDRGYYQDSSLGPEATFQPKPGHLEHAKAVLETLPAGPRAFVHVRRGDYRNWSAFGRSPLLDLQYFRDGMARIRESHPGTQFILLSDELPAMTAEFASEGVHPFHGANVYEDFAMMTLCDGGVISNSTLSWWGGCKCRRTLPVVAPRGFIAFGLGFEYPPGIVAGWLTPIDA
jgi:hypothetical protein